MKKIFSLLLAASAFACTQEKVVEITISNPSTTDRTNEITEITSHAIAKLKGETFIISDNTGSQVPYQVTYDNKIIFPVSVKGGENVTYKITPGTPEAFKTIACGKQYPERVDDIAWENDRLPYLRSGLASYRRESLWLRYLGKMCIRTDCRHALQNRTRSGNKS